MSQFSPSAICLKERLQQLISIDHATDYSWLPLQMFLCPAQSSPNSVQQYIVLLIPGKFPFLSFPVCTAQCLPKPELPLCTHRPFSGGTCSSLISCMCCTEHLGCFPWYIMSLLPQLLFSASWEYQLWKPISLLVHISAVQCVVLFFHMTSISLWFHLV